MIRRMTRTTPPQPLEARSPLCHKTPSAKGRIGMDRQSTRRATMAVRRECEPEAIYAPHVLADGLSGLAAAPIFAATLTPAAPPPLRRRWLRIGSVVRLRREHLSPIVRPLNLY